MRAAIAMMADEDLETLVELRKIRFVRAEEEHQLRRGRDHIGDAALLRIAEHQPPHPRRAHMDDVEAIPHPAVFRSEEHTSELQSLIRISYAVFCLKKKIQKKEIKTKTHTTKIIHPKPHKYIILN